MKRLRTAFISLMAIAGLVAVPLLSPVVYAAEFNASCSSPTDCISNGLSNTGGSNGQADLGAMIKTVVNVLLFILGAIAVIMIIIGGIRYTTSNGDASQTKAAKDTILYAVVGVVVAILAYAIVNFVISSFTKK